MKPSEIKAKFLKQNLQPGETYAGLILGQNGAQDHHLFLLPGEAESVDWEAAKKWATKQGGELPTRREQSVLFANCKDQFQPTWYWSGEQHASTASFAWCQYFTNGGQNYYPTDFTLRARAVRRLTLQ
jgi:hypothetical protein